jgi:hypothetical protein
MRITGLACVPRTKSSRVDGHRFAATVPINLLSSADGEAIDIVMASLDLASLDDDALAAASLRASPCARWIEERPPPHPSVEPTHAVRFSAGRFSGDIDNRSASAYRLTSRGLLESR